MRIATLNHPARALAFAVAVAPFLWGCGGSGVDLNRVKGTVMLDGNPLPDARVIFTPKEGGRPAYGVTDARGNYDLGYTTEGMGTPPGEYVVSIRTFRAPEEDLDTGEMTPAVAETVPSVYNSPSTLTVTVPSDTYDFDLKSDAGPVVQPEGDD
jgi:hypothetical protein